MMGRSDDGSDASVDGDTDEQPEHEVVVADFYLDKYEVTVERFRAFVASGSWLPEAGAGAHSEIPDTGWSATWYNEIPSTVAGWESALTCSGTYATWLSEGTMNATLPANCVNWFEAAAFCIWDGGRLPTEAEWEYVAAGGDENRLYPWGRDAPTCDLANHVACASGASLVGSHDGVGRWGHHDLAGNVWEWTFDWYDAEFYADRAATGTNVCNLLEATDHVGRGGHFGAAAAELRAASRGGSEWGRRGHDYHNGVRCARNP